MRRSRPRDNKGRFISSSQFPETFGSTKIPLTNLADNYAGTKHKKGSTSGKEILEGELPIQEGVRLSIGSFSTHISANMVNNEREKEKQ